MDAQLKSQLNQTINVATLSSRDAFGDPTYGTPTEVKCRVTLKRRHDVLNARAVGGTHGDERVTTHRIYTEVAITIDDRIWLPGIDETDATLARAPLWVHIVADEKGNIDHYEVTI